MSRQLLIQGCALIALVIAATRAGVSSQRPFGDAWGTLIVIGALMVVILAATVVPL